MNLFRTLIFVLILVNFVPAQSKKPMSINDMYDVKSLSNGRISHNGQKLLFQITEFDIFNFRYLNSLWIKDLYQNKKPYKVTFFDSTFSNPAWHPGGKKISYLSKSENGSSQIFEVELAGGKPKQIFSHKTEIKSYAWISENIIYFLADDERAEPEIQNFLLRRDFYFYDEDNVVTSLWEYEVNTNKFRKLTKNLDIRGYRLSPDKKSLGVIATPSSNPNDALTIEIYLINLEDLSVKKLTNNKIIEREFAFSPDGTYITFVSDASENLETYYQDSIFKLEIESGKTTDLLPGFNFQVVDHQWDSKNEIIYFTANKGVTQQIFTLKNEKVDQITNVKGVIRSFIAYPYKKMLIYLMSDPETPGDFFLSYTNNKKVKRLTEENPQLKKYALGNHKNIFWKSNDGTEIEGVIIYPPNFDKNKKYPLVVQLHGGPNGSYKLEFGLSWVTYPNVLAGKDYIVFQPNYRGSTGYGDKFMRGIIGNFFKLGTEDIISGTKFLVDLGVADGNKLILQGFSAGAHFTNWIITQTNMFKAASSGAGLSNWISFYAQNEVPYLREIWLQGNPYENIEKWTKLSPITYVNQVKTPTFLFCGEKDPRVPFPQTVEMWRGLKRFNVPVRLLSFKEEGHYLGNLQNQISKMKYELEWFETYLK